MSIEERKFVVQSPGRIEHLAVRKRDWKTIYDSIMDCEPKLIWASALGWGALGAGIGGLFSYAGIKDTDASAFIKSASIVAAIALIAIGIICLLMSREMTKTAKSAAARIRLQMDAIQEESDREEGF